MFLFAWLSTKPGNRVVYYPNRILKGMDPFEGGSVTRNPFTWIREAISSSEADVINMSGVDSAVYFVFLTTVLGILVLAALALLPTLLPVSVTDHIPLTENSTVSNGTFNELDKFTMANIQRESPRFWAHVGACYWISIVAFILLWKAYKHVSELRATALMAPDIRAEQFAVLVRDIPPPLKGQTRKEQVDSYFHDIYGDTFYRSMVVTDNKKVNKIYEESVGYEKKLERAEFVYAETKKTATHKSGFLGLLGPKVESIEFYKTKISELTTKLEAEQKLTLGQKQQAAAFAFFTNRVTAASAAQSLHARMVDTWTVTDAPEPRQIIWSNLSKNFYQRQIRQYVIYVVVFLTIIFFMIPITFISGLTTLPNLRKTLPFLKPIIDQDAIKTVLGAFLPQLALIVFLALLPKFLLFLSKAEGIPLESHAIRAASGKYFYFSVFNVFIGVTLSGSLLENLKEIQKNPNSIVELLGTSLPGQATFFLTFVALKFFIGYGLELSRIVPLILYHLKKKYLCKTEAEIKAAWAPGDLGYGTRIPGDLLIITIVLSYSVIAPVILPFGVLYFGLGWLIHRNQVLKVYVPSYESYGRMWPHIHTRILASLILFQVTMIGYFITKKFFYAPVLIPLPILSLLFAYVCNKKFYRFFQSTALEVACRELNESPNMEVVYKAFVPPSLSAGKSDDVHAEGAMSHRISKAESCV
jgi:hypothetical protein